MLNLPLELFCVFISIPSCDFPLGMRDWVDLLFIGMFLCIHTRSVSKELAQEEHAAMQYYVTHFKALLVPTFIQLILSKEY